MTAAATDAKAPQPSGGEVTRTGGSATTREVVGIGGELGWSCLHVGDKEADVDGARDASTGNGPGKVKGVRSGERGATKGNPSP